MPRPNPIEAARASTEAVYSGAAWRLRDAVESGDLEAIERAWHDYKQATGKPLDSIREAHRESNLEGMLNAIDNAYGRRPGVTVDDHGDEAGESNDSKGNATNGNDDNNADASEVLAMEAGKGNRDQRRDGNRAVDPEGNRDA